MNDYKPEGYYNKAYALSITSKNGILTKIITIISKLKVITEDMGNDLNEITSRINSIVIDSAIFDIITNSEGETYRGDHLASTVTKLNKLRQILADDSIKPDRSLGLIFTSKRAHELLAEGRRLSEDGQTMLDTLDAGRYDRSTIMEWLQLDKWPDERSFFEGTEMEILISKYQ